MEWGEVFVDKVETLGKLTRGKKLLSWMKYWDGLVVTKGSDLPISA
jgi:hypothetical protein